VYGGLSQTSGFGWICLFKLSLYLSLAPVLLSPAICQRGREGPISLAMSVRSLKAYQSLLVHPSWQAFPHSICLICRAEKLPREDKVRKNTSGGEETGKLFLRFSSKHGR